ncbi:MAG: lipid-binding SYLF domain-containing protein [Planctomycetota bacterium]
MFRQLGIGAASALLLLVVVGAGGCMSAKGETLEEKREYALDMQSTVLEELYEQKPAAKASVESAAGYGVFTNLGSKIFLLATGSGYGVVHDNKTGKDTYMKMIEVGGGHQEVQGGLRVPRRGGDAQVCRTGLGVRR